MNFIKKSLQLSVYVFATALLFSCSSDDSGSSNDDGNGNGNENEEELSAFAQKLVGTWELRARGDLELSECRLNTQLRFTEDGGIEFDYVYGDDSSNCSSDLQVGTWESNTDNQITVNWDDQEEDQVIDITYEDNAQRMLYSPFVYEDTYEKL